MMCIVKPQRKGRVIEKDRGKYIMKIATVLFTYNRSHHANRVIEALKCNTVLPQKLFIFQDGCREGEDDTEWKKVNHLIYDIDW
ncbi:MAG: hypothetical protein K2K20_05825, partial [Lachnospiraceae bacterium]|nr:hypothetical protein [Lachnospiraceae bacterium]